MLYFAIEMFPLTVWIESNDFDFVGKPFADFGDLVSAHNAFQ